MSESEEPLLSAEELSAIEDMVADGSLGVRRLAITRKPRLFRLLETRRTLEQVQ